MAREGQGLSVLATRHDDDDDICIYIYIYIYIYVQVCVSVCFGRESCVE